MQDIEMKDKNYIKDAEKIANIVTAGVENKEYSKTRFRFLSVPGF